MTSDQADVARSWLKAVQDEVAALKAQKPESRRNSRTILLLKNDRKIEWSPESGSFVNMVAKYPRGIPALPVPVVYDITHLQDQLTQNNDRISVAARYGPITGGRTSNGVAVFLGMNPFIYLLDEIITRSMNRDPLCPSSQAVYGS